MAVTRSGGKRRRTSGNEYCFNDNDFISRLPDGILLSILEKLPVKDCLRASAVARRWEHLWKSVSTIHVNDCIEKDGGKSAKKFLTSFIRNNRSDKLKNFSAYLTHNGSKSAAHKWTSFAVSKKVEELSLELYISEYMWTGKPYPVVQFPDGLFKCSSLVRVKLTLANLNPLPSFHLQSLKELRLDRSQLPHDGVEIITAYSPVLEQLVLSNCNRDTNLNITVAAHSNLLKLIVDDKACLFRGLPTPETSIQAPKVKTLSIKANTHLRKYSLDNVPDLVEATLDFLDINQPRSVRGYEPPIREITGKILEKLERTKKLRLCTRGILTVAAMKERDLKFNLTRLELDTHLCWKEVTGISLLCRACCQLEELVVNIRMPQVLYLDNNEADGVNALADHHHLPLKRLTFVEFKNFNGYYQTWGGNFSIREFFQGCEIGLLLIMHLKRPIAGVRQYLFTTSKQQYRTTVLPTVWF